MCVRAGHLWSSARGLRVSDSSTSATPAQLWVSLSLSLIGGGCLGTGSHRGLQGQARTGGLNGPGHRITARPAPPGHATPRHAPEPEAGARGDEDVGGVEHEAAGGARGVHGADGGHQLHGEGPEELLREALRRPPLAVRRDVPGIGLARGVWRKWGLCLEGEGGAQRWGVSRRRVNHARTDGRTGRPQASLRHHDDGALPPSLPLHDALGAREVLVHEEERLVPVLHERLAEPHDVRVL